MNTQHLETQNESAAYSPVVTPESTTETEEKTAHSLPTDFEVQQAFAQIKAKSRGYRFRSGVRSVFRSQQDTVEDPDQILEMDFDARLAILREESRKRALRQKRFIGIFLSIVFLVVLLAIFTHNTSFFNYMGSYVSLLTIGAAASQNQKFAALSIAQFNDVRAVGPLAEALEYKDKVVLPIAEKALIGLLPRMKASDAHLLSPEQRAYLNRALRGKNIELTLAILKAWEQVGDTKAIEDVEKLAAGRGQGGRNPNVVAAAQECLPFLRQSAERQQIGSQLLRPSDGNLTPSDVLLRPSMPHASTEPPNQLLRPTEDAV